MIAPNKINFATVSRATPSRGWWWDVSSKIVHVVKGKKLKEFKFIRRGECWFCGGIKVTKNNREQVGGSWLLDPLNNKVLSMQSSNDVITREISRNNSKFKVMFKEKVYRYSISGMNINFVDMRSKVFIYHYSSTSFRAICTWPEVCIRGGC